MWEMPGLAPDDQAPPLIHHSNHALETYVSTDNRPTQADLDRSLDSDEPWTRTELLLAALIDQVNLATYFSMQPEGTIRVARPPGILKTDLEAEVGETYAPLASTRDGRRSYSDHRDLPTD
jgi:hypothetical protein